MNILYLIGGVIVVMLARIQAELFSIEKELEKIKEKENEE